MEFVVDGEPVDFSETWTYKGFAYSDVPNLASSFGYINASWTLRADLTCEYVCRLLNHMDATGTCQCTPRLRPSDAGMPARPWIEGFSSGYMQRVLHLLPKQGDREPWINPQSYTPGQEDVPQGPARRRRDAVHPAPSRPRRPAPRRRGGAMTTATHRPWSSEACRLDDFVTIVETPTELDEYPTRQPSSRACSSTRRVRCDRSRQRADGADGVRAELAAAILDGPGIVKFAGAFSATCSMPSTATFERIIADEREAGDRRAATTTPNRAPMTASGTPSRSSPSATRPASSTTTPTTSSPWRPSPGSGPAYQVTSQVNVVNPGGDAQAPHRDYHLGFTTDDRAPSTRRTSTASRRR